MILIGNSENEHISIKLSSEFSADGMAQVAVNVRVNGFIAEISAYLDLYALQSFQSSLAVLAQKLKGSSILSPLEDQFTVKLEGDGRGHIEVTGYAFAEAAYGSCLKYEFGIDQTYLPGILSSINASLK